MADVLSQSQIDALLNSFSSEGTKAFDEIEEQSKEQKIKNYDLRSSTLSLKTTPECCPPILPVL